MSMIPTRKRKEEQGFSLVELMVAVGLFAFVMTIASGSYLVMINLNRQAQSVATGINSLSSALEYMTREIRTGSGYVCGVSEGCNVTSFSFTNKKNESVTYAFDSAAKSITFSKNGSVAAPLTDPTIAINSARFYVYDTQTPPADTGQPRVTIVIAGEVAAGPGKIRSFNIQTGATMRGSDI